MIILLWNKQENMRKRMSKSSFNLSGKFVPLLVLFFSEIEDYRKVLVYILFSCKWLSLILLWCLFIVWYVKVLAAGYLLKMWKNVTSNYYFETPYSFKRSILCEAGNIVQLTRLLMENQNLLEKHARIFSNARN